jgi:hypothetical protein
VGINRK